MTIEFAAPPATDAGAPISNAAPVPAAAPASSSNATPAPAVPDYLRESYRLEVAAGRLSQADADRMLAEDTGQSPDAVAKPPQQSADGTPTAAAWLEQHGTPAAKPEEFVLPPIGDGKLTDAKALEEAAVFRSWMSEALLPAPIGNAIAEAAAAHESQWLGADDVGREITTRTTEAQLRKLWGQDFARKLQSAQDLVAEVEARRPGLVAWLEGSGAGSNLQVVAWLGEHADLLSRRLDRKAA